jgi:hypothetical protein
MENKKPLNEELGRMRKLAGLINEEHYIDEPPHDQTFELPQNKKSINTKLSTKEAIKNALFKILQVEKVEGRYHDDNWAGVSKFKNVLTEIGAEVDLEKSGYEGHGTVKDYESMPTKKIYIFNITVRNKKGTTITIPFKVTCAFVGQTGTMVDDVYELTYYAMA